MRLRFFLILLLGFQIHFFTPVKSAPAVSAEKNVLMLFPYQADLPQTILAQQSVRAEFEGASDLKINWYYEYLDLSRFPSKAHQRELVNLYAEKYRDTPIDLILILGDQMLVFWLEYRSQINLNAPAVFF